MGTEKSRRDATDAVIVALLVVTSMISAGIAVVGAADGQASAVTDGTSELDRAESVATAAQQDAALSGSINLSDADTEIRGEASEDTAGWSLTAIGDANGDGHDDVLVGVPRNDTAGNDSGAAFLFYGPVEPGDIALSDADATFTGVSSHDWAGYSVGGGDVNGDGEADVVVGAPLNDTAGENAGAAYVFYGGESLSGMHPLADADATFVGESADDKAGWSVDVASNATASGAGAILVGAPSEDSGGPEAGAAYAVSGEEPPSGVASLSEATAKLMGEEAGDRAGWSLSSAEDVDGDGLADIVVGARDANATAPNAGAAYVVSDALGVGGTGSTDVETVSLAHADARLTGVGAHDRAGFSVSSAGDVNDDGYADVLVGAPYNDSTAKDAGAAYVVYGRETLADRSLADADVVLRGEAAGDKAGWSVSSAGSGDVTCDDYADLLVGAPFHNASAGPSAGAAYLVAGGEGHRAVDLADATATLVGEAARDRAGYEVSDVGDVNADGNKDVLVGAPFNDDGAKNAGAAYVVHGICKEDSKTTDRADVDTVTETFTKTTEEPTTTMKATEKTTKDTTETTTTKGKTTKSTETAATPTTEKTTTEKTPTETTTKETTTEKPTTTTETTTETTQTTQTTTKTTTTKTKTTTETTETTTTETTTTETTTETTTTETTTTSVTTTETTTTETTTDTTTETATETITTETTTTETATTETTTDTTTETTTTETTTTETTTTETTTEATTTETTTTTTERDDRAAISFVAFCVEGGKGPGNDPCPDGERLLVKFEWNGNRFVPEDGDAEGVTIQATAFKDGDPSEPVAATWTSVEEISTVIVKSGPTTCRYPGGTAGTVESCESSAGQQSRPALPSGSTLIGGTFAATVLASRRRE